MPQLQSLIYVSRSLIGPGELSAIEADSMARNSALDLTGMMLVSPGHLLELIEGSRDGVGKAKARAVNASYHHEVRILRHERTVRRRCARWCMIRLTSENFGGGTVAPILAALHVKTDANAMVELDRLIDRILA